MAHRIWPHLLAGSMTLIVAMFMVGTSSFVFVDEGALLGQIEVRDRGAWTVQDPAPDVDFDERLVPMIRSEVIDGGYAPYVKHPLYVEITRTLHGIGGITAIRLFVTMSVLCAGAGSWALCHRHPRAVAATAFWITVLASPLLFDAQLLIAHGPAAGIAAWMLVALDRHVGTRLWAEVALAIGLGSLIRSEFVLLGLCVAVVMGVRGLLKRSLDIVTGASAGIAAVGVYLLEPRWTRSLIGETVGLQVLSSASGEGASAFLDTFRRTLAGTVSSVRGFPSTDVLLVAIALGVVALVLLRVGRDPGLAILPAVLAMASSVAFLVEPTMASGFLVGFPMFFLLLLPSGGPGHRAGDLQWIPYVVSLFALAILATQYSDIGGFEWGWRYFAIALPAITPFLAVRIVATWKRVDQKGRLALSAVVIAFSLIPVAGLREASRLIDLTANFESAIEEELQPADVDLFITVSRPLGRFAYDLSLSGRLALVEEDSIDELVAVLADEGLRRVMVIWQYDNSPMAALGQYRTAEISLEIPEFGVQARILELN